MERRPTLKAIYQPRHFGKFGRALRIQAKCLRVRSQMMRGERRTSRYGQRALSSPRSAKETLCQLTMACERAPDCQDRPASLSVDWSMILCRG